RYRKPQGSPRADPTGPSAVQRRGRPVRAVGGRATVRAEPERRRGAKREDLRVRRQARAEEAGGGRGCRAPGRVASVRGSRRRDRAIPASAAPRRHLASVSTFASEGDRLPMRLLTWTLFTLALTVAPFAMALETRVVPPSPGQGEIVTFFLAGVRGA